MMGDVKFEGMTPEDAACNWIRTNIDYVNDLIPGIFSFFSFIFLDGTEQKKKKHFFFLL